MCTQVFKEMDEDGAGTLDMQEARMFCEELLGKRYPGKEFDDEKFKIGFNRIDDDKSG